MNKDITKSVYDLLCTRKMWDRAWHNILNKGRFDANTYDELYSFLEKGNYRKLAKELAYGTYKFSTPTKVLLSKSGTSRKRTVYTYTQLERFYLSVLYQCLCEVFKDELYDNCYSYKTGVSVAVAVRKMQGEYNKRNQWGVKLDIHAYFNSVDKDYLYKCIDTLFPETEPIRETIKQLYMQDKVNFHGEIIEEYKGLIPGCALGSFWANYCLRDIDKHFIGKPYARYSDDILLFGDSEEEVQTELNWVLQKLAEYGLTVNPDKYTFFKPEDPVVFLGLEMSGDTIDISKHGIDKLKRTIKRWCRKGRKEIDLHGASFDTVAKRIMSRWDYRMYKSYIFDASKFGWGYYAFKSINTDKSLKYLDRYVIDTLRALKTGTYSKENEFAVSDEEWYTIGFVRSADLYAIYKEDFEYYCDIVARMC